MQIIKNELINKKTIRTTNNNTFQSTNDEMNVFHLWVWFFTNTNVLEKTQIKNQTKQKIFTYTFLNIDFRYVQIWFWVCLSKEKLTLDMSKYDFEYVCQEGKIDFRHVEIWLWVCLLKEKLTLDITKYDFEYVC
jgi:hypothetical protein